MPLFDDSRIWMFGWTDIVKVAIACSLGAYVFAHRTSFGFHFNPKPKSPYDPWVMTPQPDTTVKAGIVEFGGNGPDGAFMEVMEGERIVGDGWCKGGKWTIKGKLFGPGPTKVGVRVAGRPATLSPLVKITVDKSVKPTLSVTNPTELAIVKPGKVTLKGLANPGNVVFAFYNGVVIGKATAGRDRVWTKVVQINEPTTKGAFTFKSNDEGETVLVQVRGSK